MYDSAYQQYRESLRTLLTELARGEPTETLESCIQDIQDMALLAWPPDLRAKYAELAGALPTRERAAKPYAEGQSCQLTA